MSALTLTIQFVETLMNGLSVNLAIYWPSGTPTLTSNPCLSIELTLSIEGNRLKTRIARIQTGCNRTSAINPPSGRFESTSEPRCRSVSSRAIYSPRPAPPVCRLRDSSSR